SHVTALRYEPSDEALAAYERLECWLLNSRGRQHKEPCCDEGSPLQGHSSSGVIPPNRDHFSPRLEPPPPQLLSPGEAFSIKGTAHDLAQPWLQPDLGSAPGAGQHGDADAGGPGPFQRQRRLGNRRPGGHDVIDQEDM